jgi:flagellin
MDVLGSTGQLELGLSRTQMDQERQVRALASGLRVNSAVDDPSGLAISEHINSKVLGLQQGVQNVQTATNLLNVADSALSIVQEILERVHGLIVEAHSDMNSDSELHSIQNEIDTLLQEINKLAGGAKFNGISLFDGHLSQNTSLAALQAQIIQVNAEPNANGTIGSPNVINATGTGGSGPLVSQTGIGPLTSVPELLEFRVLSYDATTGNDVVQLTAYSVAGTTAFGQAPEMQDIALIPVNGSPITGISTPTPSGGGVMLQNYTIANLTPQDVGSAIAFLVINPNFGATAAPSGNPLQVNSGGGEGQVVSIALPAIDTNALGLTGINVLSSAVIDSNNNITSPTSSNTYAADYAELQVQGAMDAVNQVRAQLGAQSVSLQEDAGDASLEIVNQVASESAIRDVNVGQAVTQFTKDQVLLQVGVSVLAQMQQDAQLVVQLVGAVNPGTTGRI